MESESSLVIFLISSEEENINESDVVKGDIFSESCKLISKESQELLSKSGRGLLGISSIFTSLESE